MSTRERAGFTLMELLLALALLLLLVGFLAMEYGAVKERRLSGIAVAEVHGIRDAIEAERLVTPGPDRLPTDLAAVPALRGQSLVDPWGQPYAVSGPRLLVYSSGPDGVAETSDDLTAPLAPLAPRRPRR
ncbi:MAG: prepilin-type N-terminal cleavage/methylation domain-containing protein [Candidatus Wallbacteria bacterium]|nr:prepilin-type N-terminal cleavage/methylation domain-containing protein [Candidatus Wallbacteria bacterium]